MPLTAAQRAKNYRYRLKQKTDKYNDFKRKDRERKAKKRASMTIKEKEVLAKHHRIAGAKNLFQSLQLMLGWVQVEVMVNLLV
jgi:hypothetical protein